MPRFKSVSKTSNSVKLLKGDEIHVKKMVKEFRLTDKKFETNSAAIRHYVNVGIAAERTTETLRHGINDKIVKENQKDAVRDELKPLSNNLKNLTDVINASMEENKKVFGDIAKRTETIEAKIDQGNEKILNGLKSVLKFGQNSLRNIIVLRSIFYVFFLGHKTGRIEPGKDNLVKWEKMITVAHERANKLSMDEVNLLPADGLEAEIIKRMSADIFRETTSQS